MGNSPHTTFPPEDRLLAASAALVMFLALACHMRSFLGPRRFLSRALKPEVNSYRPPLRRPLRPLAILSRSCRPRIVLPPEELVTPIFRPRI